MRTQFDVKKLKNNLPMYSKIGMNEIEGLEEVLRKLAAPILASVKDRMYWDESLDFERAEYNSRDGFVAYSHNCGGLMLHTVIPKCEEYEFGFLSFGECDTPEECVEYCSCDGEGHLDAGLRIWLKFEGFDENNEMQFYFVVAGGNGDAPYFRSKYEDTYFEESFSVKTLKQLERKGASAVKKLLKVISK